MSDRPEKRMVEFIESYWTGGEYGSDYRWDDNHGELVRCRDCRFKKKSDTLFKSYWCVFLNNARKQGGIEWK